MVCEYPPPFPSPDAPPERALRYCFRLWKPSRVSSFGDWSREGLQFYAVHFEDESAEIHGGRLVGSGLSRMPLSLRRLELREGDKGFLPARVELLSIHGIIWRGLC